MSLPTGVIKLELETGPVVANGAKVEDTLNRIATKSESTGKKMELSVKQVTASMIGLGTSAFSAYQGFDQLEKVQLRAEKSALQVARAQKQVNDLARDGKQGTEAYAIATERLRLAQEQASQAAQDVKQQTVQLGLSLATTGSTMVTTIISLRGMATAHVVAGSAAIGQATANAGLTASFRALTVAMMSNPLGIALVAASVGALAVYSTNLFGVRDKVDSLTASFIGGKAKVDDFHDVLSKDGVGAMKDYAVATNNAGDAISQTTSKLDGLSDKMRASVIKWEELNSVLKKNDLGEVIGNLEYFGTIADTVLRIQGALDEKRIYDLYNKPIDETNDPRLRKNKTKIQSGSGGYIVIDGIAVPISEAMTLGFRNIVEAGPGFIQLGARRISEITPADSRDQIGRFLSYSRTVNTRAPLGGQVGKLAIAYSTAGGVNVTGIGLDKAYAAAGIRSTNVGGSGRNAVGGKNRRRGHSPTSSIHKYGVKLEQQFGDWLSPDEMSQIITRGFQSNRAGYRDEEAQLKAVTAQLQALATQRYRAQFEPFGGLETIQNQASILGMDFGTVFNTLKDTQTSGDIAGMILYKQLASLG